MKNREMRILEERRGIMRDATDLMREGQPVTPEVLAAIKAFNQEYPVHPITMQSLRRSLNARLRASRQNEFGIQLNPKLNRMIRDEAAPLLYSD